MFVFAAEIREGADGRVPPSHSCVAEVRGGGGGGGEGGLLLSGGQDGIVKAWDPRVAGTSPVAECAAHVAAGGGASGAVGDIVQTSGGRVATAGADGHVAGMPLLYYYTTFSARLRPRYISVSLTTAHTTRGGHPPMISTLQGAQGAKTTR